MKTRICFGILALLLCVSLSWNYYQVNRLNKILKDDSANSAVVAVESNVIIAARQLSSQGQPTSIGATEPAAIEVAYGAGILHGLENTFSGLGIQGVTETSQNLQYAAMILQSPASYSSEQVRQYVGFVKATT